MEIVKFLESLNQPDPNELIKQLQNFFKEINAVTMSNPYDLVSLYSTLSVLGSNGLNKDSVKAIKLAIKAKMIGLFKQAPGHVKYAALSLKSLIETDSSLMSGEQSTTELR